MAEFYVLQRCTWLYTPRGGYGYTIPIDAQITAIKGERAQIEVQKKNGDFVKRWVKLENLKPLEGEFCANCGNLLEPDERHPSKTFPGFTCDGCYDLGM